VLVAFFLRRCRFFFFAEYKFLMNNKAELTEAELLSLLQSNELAHYDPVAEAFKIYDPADTGAIDLDVFREILHNLGFGDITEQDVQTLIDSADVDGDGKVSLADFRRMLPNSSGDMGVGAGAGGVGGGTPAKPHKK
jgi:Ca2+-binding EF-hand superfamily protein